MLCAGCGRNTDNRKLTAELSAMVSTATRQAAEGDPSAALSSLHHILTNIQENPGLLTDKQHVDTYRLLGDLHTDFDDYASAATYYENALQHSDNRNDIIYLHHRLTICYSNLKELARAEEHHHEFLTLTRGDESYDFEQTLSTGYFEKAFGSRQLSAALMKKALDIIDRESLDTMLRELPALELISLYNARNQPDSAIMLLRKVERIAEIKGSKTRKADFMYCHMRSWMLKGELDSSQKYQKIYFDLMNEQRGSEAFMALSQRFDIEEENKKQERIVSLQHSVSARQFLLICVAVGAIAAFLFVLQVKRDRATRRRFFMLDFAAHNFEKEIRRSGEKKIEAIYAESAEAFRNSRTPVDPTHAHLFKQITDIVSSPEIFTDPTFSLPRLAEMLGTNTKYVSLAIKESTGFNFRTYLNDFRIREARRRLLDTDNYGMLTIQSVAESVGFMSQSSFIAAFKQFTGTTPSYYIKMAQSKQPPYDNY